jgi:deazaflavin-dependent oxidoreductase (nitroreductase family)
MPDGDNLVIVASLLGSPKNPAWYHNLRAHPGDVEVDVRGGRRAVRARRATREEQPGCGGASSRPIRRSRPTSPEPTGSSRS